MALTPTAAWYAACDRQDAEWRVLISITDGVTTWQALSGSSAIAALLPVPSAIMGVSSVAEETDPVTRESEIGELWVEVADAWIRPILVNNRLVGKKLTAKLGARSLAEADYLALFAGPIEGIEPVDAMRVKLIVGNLLSQLDNTQVAGVWRGKHPYQCLYDAAGGGILEKAGLTASEVTAATFLPSNYSATVSHFVTCPVAPADGPTMDLPAVGATSALELVNGVLQVCYSALINDESGALKIVRFDDTAAAVADLTEDDFLEGSWEQDAFESGIINRVLIRARPDVFGSMSSGSYQCDEAASQAAHAYPGLTERVFSREIDASWYSGTFGILATTIDDNDTTVVFNFDIHSFCGMRDGYPAAGQDADAKLSAARVAYFLLMKWDGSEREIVKCAAATTLSGYARQRCIDPSSGAWSSYDYSGQVTATVTREQFGTTAVAHAALETRVWDITLFVYLAEQLLRRFAYGVPPVRFDLPLRWAWLQRGDLVTLTQPKYLAYGFDGITSSQKWEIVKKEVTVVGGAPRISIGCAYAGVNTPTLTVIPRQAESAGMAQFNTATDGTLSQGFVASGCGVTSVAALTVSVAAGTANHGVGYNRGIDAAFNHDCTASKDTYFVLDATSGAVRAYEVANGAAQPTKIGTEQWLAKVVTDGAGVTSVTDMRQTAPLLGAKLVDGAVIEAKLGPLSVTETKLGVASVTATKVGAAALGPYHWTKKDKRNSLFSNAAFGIRTLG